MINLIRAWCIANDLLKEQDLRTSTPQRWRSKQLTSTMLVCPSSFGPGRVGSVLPAWQPLGVGFPEVSEVPAVAAMPLR